MKKYSDIKREVSVLKFVWKMAKGEHAKILSVLPIGILSAMLPAIAAYLIKTFIDNNELNFTKILNKDDMALYFSIFICGVFLNILSRFIMGHAMPNIKRNIDICCVRKISTLPYSYISDYVDNRIIMTLSVESVILSNLIPMVYNSFIKAPVAILGFIIILIFISPLLTLICFILIGTIIVGILLFRKAVKRLNEKLYNRIGDLHQYFSEWLSGYKVFMLSGATSFAEKKINQVSVESSDLSKRITTVNSLQTFIIEIITIIATVFFVWLTIQSSISGNASGISKLILFPAAILFIRGEVLKIIYGYMQLAGAESAARRIIDIIEFPECAQTSAELSCKTIESITFKDVTFGYKDSCTKVFDSANITLQKGEVNTIIGRSGTGKTTFINLCMRLREPDSGSVMYNTEDISSVLPEKLSHRVALVEQEPFIFDGTLAENIFFDAEQDTEYALKLLKKFDLSFLADNKENLYKTQIGTNHRLLSTGEKQRISIIRALVKNTDVIFFDEVTSNLDHHNTKMIINHICELAESKLVICVSHDLMLIKNSTRLYEIKDSVIKRI